MCNVCLIHCNCSCIYNVKFLCIFKAQFRVCMHVRLFIFKIRYVVSLFRHFTFDYHFSLTCMGCRNSDKVYVANLRQFTYKQGLTIFYFICIHYCYYNTNIVYNITMNNVQISVAKGDISLHGACVGHSSFSY